jgi:hypothetical protein
MLADRPALATFGELGSGILANGRSRIAILDFILSQLPTWRDRSDRPVITGETGLTSQLCAHLNSAARKTKGWDSFQFRVEEADETSASRKIDLVVAACGDELIVEGRNYADFETILPIECKRLPIPTASDRDEREYVFSNKGIRGGIQRYKEGKHGAKHIRAALIAYVQEHSFDHWFNRVEEWIRELHTTGNPGWSPADELVKHSLDIDAGVAVHESVHTRGSELPEIQLRHMWVMMA